MTDPKRPSFPWYPGDHRRDTNVQGCSYAARGLWGEMMNLMHDGEPYGHLTSGGKGMTDAQLASMTGGQLPLVKKLLRELWDAKVYSRTAAGVIYCRRMVKDEARRHQKKTNGKLGGNPKLLNQQDNGQDIHPLNQPDNHGVNGSDNRTPASAVAVASALPPPPPLRASDEAQSPNGSTAQTMVSIVPAEFRPDMRSLMLLVPHVTAWTAEMRAAIEGMHGKPITALQLGQAVRDYLASGKAKLSPSLRSFRRYMQGVIEVDVNAPRSGGANGKRSGRQEFDYSKTTDRIEDVKWQT